MLPADAFSQTPRPGREDALAAWRPLPPTRAVDLQLGAAIRQRVSCRTFASDPMDFRSLATLLHNAYGVIGANRDGTAQFPERAVPSAGGLYPLELSVIVRAVEGLPPGVHHYVPAADALEVVREGELPANLLSYLFMGQTWTAEAAVVVIVSAVTARSLSKYGDRGYRYLLIEAGHVAQNLNLVAAALGLGGVNLGAFYDDELADLLGMDVDQEIALYGIAIGHPRSPRAFRNVRRR